MNGLDSHERFRSSSNVKNHLIRLHSVQLFAFKFFFRFGFEVIAYKSVSSESHIYTIRKEKSVSLFLFSFLLYSCVSIVERAKTCEICFSFFNIVKPMPKGNDTLGVRFKADWWLKAMIRKKE